MVGSGMAGARKREASVSKLRSSGIVLLVVLGVLLGAGIATAEVGEGLDHEAGDTQFNFGYDAENHVFMFNTSATDSPYDCRLKNGPLTPGYGDVIDGLVPVDTLEDGEGPVTFEPRDPEDVGEEFEPAEDPVEYTGPDGECSLTGAVVGGPNGQINHGQFMKLFNQLIDMRGRGCLNRHLAKSTLGKDDQQVRTPDVDEAFEVGEGMAVEFETALAACERGKKDKDKAGNGHGRPDSPGKSGQAPGRNK